MTMDGAKAYLLLEDGTVLEGRPLGARGKTIGRVVFNTGMVGYQQLLTDPANRGILLMQTFPLIGNYGVNAADAESDRIQAAGYIVREHCEAPSNYRCEGRLVDLLEANGTVGICGIDTRHLTKLIRERGEMKGMILSEGAFDRDALLQELTAWQPGDLIGAGAPAAEVKCGEGCCRVGVLDLGATRSQYHTLQANGMEPVCLPYTMTAEEIRRVHAETPLDGILISDGPGDPAARPELAETVKGILELGIPVLGIAQGHLLLALAHGFRLRTLKYGHRGANQPVLNLQTGRTYITTQNHVYAVDESSAAEDIGEVNYINANDKSVEGIVYRDGSVGVQFVPDGTPGQQSTLFIYENWKQKIMDRKGQVK